MIADYFLILYIVYLFLVTKPKWQNTFERLISLRNFMLLRTMVEYTLILWKPTYEVSYIKSFLQFLCFGIFEEFFAYFSHRLIHRHYFLYKNIHKMHHQFYAEDFLLSFYMSISEIIIFIYPTALVGGWFLFLIGQNISMLTLNIWYATTILFFLWSHSGEPKNSFIHKIMPDNSFHRNHHLYPKYNFGSEWLDNLFKTRKPKKKLC